MGTPSCRGPLRARENQSALGNTHMLSRETLEMYRRMTLSER